MTQAFSLLGAFLILVPFAAVQFNYLEAKSLLYQGLNFIGSVILFTVAVIENQYGFILMEGAWAIVSLYGMYSTVKQYKQDADG